MFSILNVAESSPWKLYVKFIEWYSKVIQKDIFFYSLMRERAKYLILFLFAHIPTKSLPVIPPNYLKINFKGNDLDNIIKLKKILHKNILDIKKEYTFITSTQKLWCLVMMPCHKGWYLLNLHRNFSPTSKIIDNGASNKIEQEKEWSGGVATFSVRGKIRNRKEKWHNPKCYMKSSNLH